MQMYHKWLIVPLLSSTFGVGSAFVLFALDERIDVCNAKQQNSTKMLLVSTKKVNKKRKNKWLGQRKVSVGASGYNDLLLVGKI